MNLELRSTGTGGVGHTLDAEINAWDEQRACIVMVYDGISDHRTPALLPDEARELARALTTLAEQVDAEDGQASAGALVGRLVAVPDPSAN